MEGHKKEGIMTFRDKICLGDDGNHGPLHPTVPEDALERQHGSYLRN